MTLVHPRCFWEICAPLRSPGIAKQRPHARMRLRKVSTDTPGVWDASATVILIAVMKLVTDGHRPRLRERGQGESFSRRLRIKSARMVARSRR
jgi:hypothetical protein